MVLWLACSGAGLAQAPASSTPAGELFRLVNQEREKAGLRTLAWDERLASAAQRHAEQMAEHGELVHDFPGELPLQQRLSQVPLVTSGENAAVDASISVAHEGLMHSTLHRGNILNPHYDAVGIGVVQRDGRFWIAQDFAQRIAQMPDAQAEAVVASAAERVRRDLPEVKDNRVHKLACRMARSDRLDTTPALQLPSAHHVAAYTSLNPEELPRDARRLLDLPGPSRLGIGACFARTPHYPSGVYWVLMVLYGSGR